MHIWSNQKIVTTVTVMKMRIVMVVNFRRIDILKMEHLVQCIQIAMEKVLGILPDKEPGENIVRRHDFYKSYTEVDPKDASNFCEETEPMTTKYNSSNNQYLATQDACDKTAMLAYNLIGDMLKEFAATECLNLNISDRSYLSHEAKETEKQSLFGKHRSGPAIVRVVEELIPSFPDSSMEKLKVLMGI